MINVPVLVCKCTWVCVCVCVLYCLSTLALMCFLKCPSLSALPLPWQLFISFETVLEDLLCKWRRGSTLVSFWLLSGLSWQRIPSGMRLMIGGTWPQRRNETIRRRKIWRLNEGRGNTEKIRKILPVYGSNIYSWTVVPCPAYLPYQIGTYYLDKVSIGKKIPFLSHIESVHPGCHWRHY